MVQSVDPVDSDKASIGRCGSSDRVVSMMKDQVLCEGVGVQYSASVVNITSRAGNAELENI